VEHPAIADLAAYLDHRLDDASRRRIEAHLVECGACRSEVMEGERVLRGAPSRRVTARRPLVLLASFATLAAAAGVLFTVLPRRGASDERFVERSPDAPAGRVTPISVDEPQDSARLTAAPATFVWRRAPGVSLYKFTLTDEQGHVLWSASTRDSLLASPASLVIPSSARYYWYVDALRADGSTASSGVHDFHVR
jgi:hypothetical protein